MSSARLGFATLAVLVAGWMLACKHAPPPPPPPPKPKNISIAIASGKDTNPNDEGRPSPVVVHIYILKDGTKFSHASFHDLTLRTDATLAAGLLEQDQSEVRPGETQSRQITVDPSANFVAVVAEFNHWMGGTWRAITAPQRKPLIDVLSSRQVKIAVSQSTVAVDLE